VTLADNALIVARVKASAVDIKAGDYVASGGVPRPDGTRKAVELRIFPDSVRGNGDGHRPGWPGAPNGTMTNGVPCRRAPESSLAAPGCGAANLLPSWIYGRSIAQKSFRPDPVA
jgi:hypothetical protein